MTVSNDLRTDSGVKNFTAEQRAIAPIVGAGIGTVHRDIESSAVPNGTPGRDSSVAVPDFEDALKLSPIVGKGENAIVTTTIKLTVRAGICYLI